MSGTTPTLGPQGATRLAVSDPVEFLAGEWSFERHIEDHLSGNSGRAEGRARFEASGAGLLWTETGILEIGGKSFDASRRMSVEPDGDGWLVRFEDGRPFHPIDLRSGECEIGHPCRDDQYEGRYLVTDGPEGPELTAEWRVSGPAKDQLIVTRYRRVAVGCPG